MKTCWWFRPPRPQKALTSKFSTNGHGVHDKNLPPPEAKPPGSLASPRMTLKSADTWGNTNVDYGVDEDKKARLVNWNVEVFGELLSKVVR